MAGLPCVHAWQACLSAALTLVVRLALLLPRLCPPLLTCLPLPPCLPACLQLHLYESLGWWRAGAELRKVRAQPSPTTHLQLSHPPSA
jgi:hypothetical protein